MKEKIIKTSRFVIYTGLLAVLLTPLLVDSNFLFPFIFTKVLMFRIVVEVMLLAYLVLNLLSGEYRPKSNWLTKLTALFIAIAAVSSFFGGNFYRSFWGDIERGEGLILWLHVLVFLVILMSAVKKERHWYAFLDYSLGVALLVSVMGLGQALKLEQVLASSGTRVDATFGNPAFFATYLLFHLAFAVLLFFKRENRLLKAYYLAAALFFVWLTLATQTRGAAMGLGAGLLAAAILSAWIYRDNPRMRKTSIAAVVMLILAFGALFFLRGQPVVKDSEILKRIASISSTERTAQTRLATWKAAWIGFKEKPLLGWGMENFDIVFNKNFPPIIYEDEGSQVWFDRAHNVVFDRAVTTGILGLGVFLGLFIYPLTYFLRTTLRDRGDQAKFGIVFIAFIVAYLIQDLFIFETAGIYGVLFFLFGFWGSRFLPEAREIKIFSFRPLNIVALAIYVIVFGPLLWYVNLFPAKVNIAAASALRSDFVNENFFEIVKRFEGVLKENTYGRQEYRLQMLEAIGLQLAPVGEVVPEVRPVLAYFDEEIQKQVQEDPQNAKNLLLAMRHYNYTYKALAGQERERLNKALDFFEALEKLSPDRPQAPQEAGYANLYLFRLEKNAAAKQAVLDKYFREAEKYFLRTVEINPQVVESYLNLIMLYLNAGTTEKINSLLGQMNERGIPYRAEPHLNRLLGLAKANQNFAATAVFAEELTKLNENNVDAWIDLALAYAYLGNREQAIATAERIKQFGGSYVEEAQEFIKNLDRGVFTIPQS